MNNLLQLKGKFDQNQKPPIIVPHSLREKKAVEVQHLYDLISELKKIQIYWESHTLIAGALISTYYYTVIAKSNRIHSLLCKRGTDPNDNVRGVKFNLDDPRNPRHIFTYYVKSDVIQDTIERLQAASEVITNQYHGTIRQDDIEQLESKKAFYPSQIALKRTTFISVVLDVSYVQKFDIDLATNEVDQLSIVTLYKTDISTVDILQRIGIDSINAKLLNDTTVRLNPAEMKLLQEEAPYLISMQVHDLREIAPDEFDTKKQEAMSIPTPRNEPTIGVIDTPFDRTAYFHDWVSDYSYITKDIELNERDYIHGTEVSSIIVDGPSLNPTLDDGCGRFRVRHFGVATAGRFSSFSVLKSIRKIVSQNQDIKVWNLSLGSVMPINQNFISPEAAELDQIQNEYDVVFIIAGTNMPPGHFGIMAIGAPADSLNSIVVNSVRKDKTPASYHRVGPVLSFFHKPDISYYGGDHDQLLRTYALNSEYFVSGTSFAAPWIARKMAYLINICDLPREAAKALLIDSAAGWNRKDDASHSIGYGVVPQRIEDIVKTREDEIRFFITGSSDSYETYSYNIPIPIYNEKQPFYARATLCYFPKCNRNQGVDYTSTEMDIHFGRVQEKKGKPMIKSINSNSQGDRTGNHLYEAEARKLYRKWDNIKLISDVLKDRCVPKKVYGNGSWGLSIKTKERLKEKNGRGMRFGVVVTLKEMDGKNRIDEFIKLCLIRGWIVNQIDVINRNEIYIKSEEDITLE